MAYAKKIILSFLISILSVLFGTSIISPLNKDNIRMHSGDNLKV